MRAWRAAAIAALFFSGAANAQPADDWPSYGRDLGGARASPLRQITPRNVDDLRVAWTYHMRPEGYDASPPPGLPEEIRARWTGMSGSQATPLVVDSVMYVPTPYGRVVALDAVTGAERWAYELPTRDQAATRGVAYWPGDREHGPRIVFGTRAGKLIAVDAATGAPAAGFGENGIIDMKTPEVMNGNPRAPLGMSSPPTVVGDLVITGSRVQEMPVIGAAGDVRAWDMRTGALVWTFHSIPRPGEVGHDTWEGDSWQNRSGVNVWTFVIADEERGIVYLPFAAPTFDRWGGDRPGQNLFGNSIVAVEAETGKYLWHFQTVHHDIWDLDIPSATLIDVRRGNRTIPAIAVMNKTAIMFILDRVTGEPLFEVTETPVPTDSDIGEHVWPTQPMPAAPPPLTRLSFSMSELANITPEHRAVCEAMIAEFNIVDSVPFQPLRADSAVATFPGSWGGIDWGGGAFDPWTGLYILNVNALASPQRMEQQPDGTYNMRDGYQYFWDRETRMPCQEPPWGELVAVNVSTGEVAWRRPLGVTEGLPGGLRETGRINAGGPIVTRSGLTFIGATDESLLRAFETRTGRELWSAELPGSNYAAPITYRGADGKQYVAAVATGGFGGSQVTSDEIVVFSLP